VIINRWQNFTGAKATLDGRTFAEVKDTRHGPNHDVCEVAHAAMGDRKAAGASNWSAAGEE
jgi:hypothetical protein